MPPALPRIDGVELAARHQPATETVIGGDFYDAFKNTDGTWTEFLRGRQRQRAAALADAVLAVLTVFDDDERRDDVTLRSRCRSRQAVSEQS